MDIIKKYNHAVKLLADAYRYKINGNDFEYHLCANDAGENFSQVIELAIKSHLKQQDKSTYNYCIRNSLPQIIDDYYVSEDGGYNDFYYCTIDGDKSDVDFRFLASNKYDLTNRSKHAGINVDIKIVEKYSQEIRKFLHDYIDNETTFMTVDDFLKPENDMISYFYNACDLFNYEERTYVLITDEDPNSYYDNFWKVKWNIIIDFYNYSEKDGFCFCNYHNQISSIKKFKIGDVVTEDDYSPYSEYPLMVFANGYKNISPKYKNIRDWNKHNSLILETMLRTLMVRNNSQKTIVVSTMRNRELVDKLIDLCDRCFANMQMVLVNLESDKMKDNGYVLEIPISLSMVNQCIETYVTGGEEQQLTDTFKLPALDASLGVFSKAELRSLEDTFEVLYAGIEKTLIDEAEDFLKGRHRLSWYGAKNEFSAYRDKFNKMYVKPIESIIKNGHAIAYIEHQPGFGGTTLARQIGWILHSDFPVLFLKNNRESHVIEQLELIHNKTKKTVILFAEIPQTIDKDDFENLFNQTNESRPFIFIGIKRGAFKQKFNSLYVTDWGDDVARLINRYEKYIDSYPEVIKKRKLAEFQNIQFGTHVEAYKRTPFYIGLLALEEKFEAIHGYISNFVEQVKNLDQQRKTIIYLAICDKYISQKLPASFLRTIFNVEDKVVFQLEQYFSNDVGVVNSLLCKGNVGNNVVWSIRHPFFTEELLKQLLGKTSSSVKHPYCNLGNYCLFFIESMADNDICSLEVKTNILKDLFIGNTSERSGEKFNQLISDIPKEEQLPIFLKLHELFPTNAHFCSHLARYYAIEEKNAVEALAYADKAINISPEDPLLHHIKGICLRSIMYQKIQKCLNEGTYQAAKRKLYDEIVVELLPKAAHEFEASRKLNKGSIDEFGYISHVEMLLKVFDFSQKYEGLSKMEIVTNAYQPYADWIDDCHNLLETLENYYNNSADGVSERYDTCEHNLRLLYEDYGSIIQKLTNQMDNSKHPQMVRRNIVRTYFYRGDYTNKEKTIGQITTLMEQNILEEPNNERNFFLWFKAARYSKYLRIDEILAKLAQWSSLSPSIDVTFYHYVFYAIKALNGSSIAAQTCRRLIEECKNKGGNKKIGIREWYGKAPQKLLSNLDVKPSDNQDAFYRVEGVVSGYEHAGAAKIITDQGLEVFFNPGKNNITKDNLNSSVTFFLGFSYDGLRAENVELSQE